MKLRLMFILFLPALMLGGCCRYHTYPCSDIIPEIKFSGFDSSQIDTIEVRYLSRAAPFHQLIAKEIITPDYGCRQAYRFNAAYILSLCNIVRTDTEDIELFVPALSRTFMIEDFKKEDKGTRTIKECYGSKIDPVLCTNNYTSCTVNGMADSLIDGAGIQLLK